MDDAIRSTMTAISTGVGTSWFWPGSADSAGASSDSAGETRPGSARIAEKTVSIDPIGRTNVKSPDGYLVTDDTALGLYNASENGEHLIGHPQMHESLTVTPSTARWVVTESFFTVTSAGDGQEFEKTAVFSPINYDGIPHVQVGAPSVGFFYGIKSITSFNFTSRFSRVANGSSYADSRVMWRSIGTVSY